MQKYTYFHTRARKGFTLIELLIVIAILTIIASFILIQIDPIRRLHQARNAQRWSDVLSIMEAVKRYQADHDGNLPSTTKAIDANVDKVQIIGENPAFGACDSVSVRNQPNHYVSGLDTDLLPYIPAIPYDPSNGSANNTRYYINVDNYNFVTVGACDSEGEGWGGGGTAPNIFVKR